MSVCSAQKYAVVPPYGGIFDTIRILNYEQIVNGPYGCSPFFVKLAKVISILLYKVVILQSVYFNDQIEQLFVAKL